jgi:hypothetical protein
VRALLEFSLTMRSGLAEILASLKPGSRDSTSRTVPLGIVTLKNRRLSPVAKLFIQHAHEVAKPLTKRK